MLKEEIMAAPIGKASTFDANTMIELKNGKLVDVIKGSYFPEATRLFIKNGKIESVVTGDNEKRASVISIDLKGRTVIPALFNVHCHIQMVNPTIFLSLNSIRMSKRFKSRQIEKSMAECLKHGIIHIRDAFSDHLAANTELRSRISKSEIPGPRIVQSVVVGPKGGYLSPEYRGIKKVLLGSFGIGKTDYANPMSGVVAFQPWASTQDVRDAVNRAIDERGAETIKVGESKEEGLLNKDPVIMSMDQLSAITDQARKRGIPSTIHCVSVETFRRAIKAGFSSLAHMPRDAVLSDADIQNFQRSGSMIEPTLSVAYDMSWPIKSDPYASDQNMKTVCDFRDRTFPSLISRFWLDDLGKAAMVGFQKARKGNYKALGVINMSGSLSHFSRMIHFGVKNTRKLLEAGVPMACGNDAGVQSCTPAMIGHEISIFNLFINSNENNPLFDPKTALRAATINSAISLGIEKQSGSIQPGKIADLAILEGDPLEDASVIGAPVDALFINGQLTNNNVNFNVTAS